MDTQLTGKRAFISGSTQGIGFAIARRLLGEGAAVVLHGRTEDSVTRAVEALRTHAPDRSVEGIAADAADPEQMAALTAQLGVVDILVNNVGMFELEDFANISDAQWQRYLDVNLMSGVRLSRHALGPMLDRGWGRILFIASESGVNVPADMMHYGVTKAGMIALGNGLAKLTRGTEVTVNTFLGGPTYSDGVAATVLQLAQAQGVAPDDLKSAIATRNQTSLLQRFIEPDEIAHLAAFLASPLSSAINGAAVRADGGTLPTML